MSNTIKIGLVGIATQTEPAFTSSNFETLLSETDTSEDVILDMHSEGGSVLEGFRMGNFVGEFEGKTIARVNVAAFSIASYIAVRCDEVEIARNGFIMIHNPKAELEGDDEELATSSKLLAQMKKSMIDAYVSKTGLDANTIKTMMKEETWLSADEAVKLGFADRIVSVDEPKAPTFTNTKSLPALVLACLGKDAGKATAATPKEQIVSKTINVATAKWIKATYPKSSAEFKFRCMEEEMTEDEVQAAHAKAMEDENEELKARLSAMEEELTALRAEEDEAIAKAKAEEDEAAAKAEEDEVLAKARAKQGLPAIARKSGTFNAAPATQQWNELIEKFVAKGKPRIQAVRMANRERPDLREALIEEANS